VGSADHKLYAINPNGTLTWTYTTGDEIYSSPSVDRSIVENGGAVYFGSSDGYLYSVRPADGVLRWQRQTGEGRILYSSPVLDLDGNVYVGADDGQLYSFAPDGDFRWSYQAGDIIYSSPAVGWDGRVYVAGYDRTLYVLRTNGTLLSSFLLAGEVFSSPVVGNDGRIYLGCLDSRLYAYPAETLLAPSSWPMFRNDDRHLGNQAFVWFEGGGFTPGGGFVFNMRSSTYSPTADYGLPYGIQKSTDLLQWQYVGSWNLKSEGFAAIGVATSGSPTAFFRAFRPFVSYPRSRNPYGYVRLTFPPGFSMISNPLNTQNNTLNGLLSDMPADTQFLKWNEVQQAYEDFYFDPVDGWLPDTSLLPGEGGFLFNPTTEPIAVTFIGEVLQGHLAKTIPTGVSIRSSMVPQAGGVTSLLGFGPEDGLAQGDRIDRYSNGLYDNYAYLTGSWYRTNPPPSILLEPQLAVGEAFWLYMNGPRIWKRDFQVWP